MLSRALSLATVMFAIVGFAADCAHAQNLEAGKSAAQIFSGNCTACHKGARGLLRTVAPGSLPGFLRQHYTTGPDMAKMLSAYLISNGATDERYRAETPRRQPGDLKPEPERAERQGRRLPSQEAVRPDADVSAQDEPQRRKDRHRRRIARPDNENLEAARPSSEEAASEHGRRKHGDKKKLSRRGKQGPEESPKADVPKQEPSQDNTVTEPETAKTQPSSAVPAKGETAKDETSKTESSKAESPKVETPKVETPKVETPKEQAAEKQTGQEQGIKADVAKPDAAKPDLTKESGKAEADKAETNKPDADKSEAKSEAERSETGRSESSKPDNGPAKAATSGEPAAVPLRADPVPAVTPAPKGGEGDAKLPSGAASSAPPPIPTDSVAAPSPSTSAESAKPTAPAAEPLAPPPSAASSAPPPAPDGPPVPE